MRKKLSWDTWRSATTRITVITAVVLAATVVWLASYFASPVDLQPPNDTDHFPGNGVAEQGHLPGMTEQDIREQMQREADKGIFAFKINTRPVFDEVDGKGALRIENPAHNVYPFVVKIFLRDTAEEIFNSGGILPNHHIDTAKLAKPLPKGEHAATAYIYAYDPDTSEYEGKAAVDLTMLVGL